MVAFLIYILKSALVLALMVSLFMLFMSRETFHRVNRCLMLSILFISFLLPAVNLGFESPFKGVIDAIKGYLLADDEPVAGDGEAGLEIAFGELIPSGHHVANKVVADTASVQDMDSEQPFDWLRFMGVLYMIGVVLLVARQLLMYFQVSRIIMRSRVVDASRYGCEGVCLRVHGGKEKPFSWFHWIVVGEDDLGDGAREILTHEAAHVKAGHSWDIMLADAVIMLQWFNPLAWIMKNTLKDIHEFEADEAVIASGVNAKQYQLLIIKKAVGARLYSIANSFNHSLTKKRITMMCKEKSKKWSCAKALYILPVAAFVACSLSTSRNAASVGKGNEFISNDASSSTGINVGITSLPSGEEWQYAHVYYTDESSGSKESVCIAYKRGAEGDNVGYFRGTTDEFDNAREGYEPGYFVVPLRNVRLEKDVMTFSIYADDATILQNPVKCAECGIVDAVNNGELWKNNASYLKGKKADFKLHLGPKFVLQNLTNPYVGGERVMGAVEIDYIYECTHEELSGDDTDIIYQVIEEQPEFPGGMKELMKWFSENINYPEEAAKAGVQGRAFVRFVVHKDGSISSPEILRSSGNELLDTEALRVVSSMPKWKPGMQGGKAVNVWFTLPVIFKLQGKPADGEITNLEVTVTREDGSVASSVAYDMVEVQPEFPGGQEAMMKYLASNIKYPAEARDAGKEGRAIVKFVVKKDGLLTDIEIARSAGDASLDGEALRVVKGMPKWNPGTQGGKPVNVQFMLPIVFKLNTGGAPVVELKGGGMAVNDPTNAAIVVDGVLLEGELTDIDSKDIESVTVVKYDALTAEDIRKYKAEGKDGVIFISLKTQGDITEVKFTEQEIRTGDYGDIMPKCEQMPIFPGGDHELMKWLSMNTRYPKVARDINAQGKIYVDFVVKADGTIADVKAINSEYSSNNAKVMDAMNLEAHFLRSQAALNMQENELRDVEECIAKWEKESKVLEEDGVAEVIMERRREELEKAKVYVEESKKRIAYARSEVENAHQRLADAKSELGEVVVTAYKNSNGESITGEELLELEKAALVALGDEAERVIRAMPKWKPGMQDGKAVNVRFTLPINFRLQ